MYKKSTIVITSLFVTLFLSMMGYLVYFTATSEQDMINNSYNSRQEILISQNYRGTIYGNKGEVLAETILETDGSEIRSYPYGEKFAHVVGFSTQGKTGIEAQANYYLINTNIPLNEKVANDIAGVKNPGDSAYTTLDVAIQEAAYKALDTYNGAIIVTDPRTGKILAMVSNPDFDPNEITDIWADLVESDDSSILLNRATQGLYPPGSTFKIVTALEYIKENPDTYLDYSFTCNGFLKEEDSIINCYHKTNHGHVDFVTSFAKSCNSSFANIGLNLDGNQFAKTLKELLFNENLPVSFNYSKSRITYNEEMSTNDIMQTAIGQGTTLITPLHLNMITAAIANGGVLYKPYLVDYIANENGTTIKSFHSDSYGRLMSEEEAAALIELMSAVVTEGTATGLSTLPYTVAGKTGSAEYNNIKGDSHAWFTGFAPADNPEICVTIIVEGAGSGGDYAVPIAKRVFNAYFNQ